MARHASLKIACVLALALAWPAAALAQPPSPEAIAAARELIAASDTAEQMKTLVPLIMRQMKPAIARGRPEIEKAYDEVMPLILKAMNSHIDEFIEAAASIYARNFTVDEMKQITAFYRQPVGQKLLQKLPVVMQESMALGQTFGQVIADDLRDQMTRELRSRGHDI